MSKEQLKVVYVEEQPMNRAELPPKKSLRAEIQQKMEALWTQDPFQFDPNRDLVQKKRIQDTFAVIQNSVHLENSLVVDLGTGFGVLAKKCRDAGAEVDAVDVASPALERLKPQVEERINLIQDFLPATRLQDDRYDLVLCTEVIGYLPPQQYRMAIAELSRLVKKEGLVFCSTELDSRSEGALGRLTELFETEFIIKRTLFAYDLLWNKLCHLLEGPRRCIKARKFRSDTSQEPFSKKWSAKLLYSPPVVCLWRLVDLFSAPLARYSRQSEHLRSGLERVTRFFWQQEGISHVLLVGQRRPLNFPLPSNKIPQERKQKRQVWE
jgi:2-polyprenyl-3-methyl-5-hydroxy-6-metoxy-1,4-benzoquinol methylase